MMDVEWMILVEVRSKILRTAILASVCGMNSLNRRNVERWRANAVDGEKWASITKKAKALRRPYSREVIE
jgi:hypothetical protein